jgi:hypothetical protein
VGQNDAAIDVPAVQQAVDNCGTVRLQGRFRFSGMETGLPPRVVTVGRSVNIVGERDGEGHRPQIIGGQTPFLVDAPGEVVRIRDLRFVRPVSRAIQAGAAMEAAITNCVIEAVEHVTPGDAVFGIVIGGAAFGAPINRVAVHANTIGTGEPVEVGIVLNNSPTSRAIGSISIDRNEVRANAHGIDLRFPGGHAQIDHNHVTIENSDRTGDPALFQLVGGIRCQGEGACSIVGNRIDNHHPNAAGIRLQGTAGAIVENNDIALTPPDELPHGSQSSGVQLIPDEKDSKRNLIGRNTVSGAARTAFSISGSDNVLVLNRHPEFTASFADLEIGEGALRTVVVNEKGSISDLGAGSVIR